MISRQFKYLVIGALVAVCLLVVASISIHDKVQATSGSTLLTETFDSLPGAPWVVGGETSTVNAGYPKVESRNSNNRLRLTRAAGNEGGYALYDEALPTTSGLDITFQFEMWGGGNQGADGIAFLMVDGATSNLQLGTLGGALGYVGLTGTGGQGSLLGIGLDRWGGFRTSTPSGGSAPSDCSTSFGFNLWADAITVRGPGSGGSQVITSSNPCSSFFGDYKLNRADNWTVRSDRVRTARIVVDPSTEVNPQVKVYMDDPYGDDAAGGNFVGTAGILDTSTPRITFAQPQELQNATSFKFGFVAATGGSSNNHDILGISVASRQPLPAVRWTTSATLPAGTIGTAYSQVLNGADGLPAYTYSLMNGTLPAGLSLTGDTLTGTPTTCEDAQFTLRITDRQSPATTSDRVFTMRVNDAQQSCVFVVPTTSTLVSSASSNSTTTLVVNTTLSTSRAKTQETLPSTGTSLLLTFLGVGFVSAGTSLMRSRRRMNP